MIRITGIIPARYGSSRFPGKPLADIHGKSMIQRVYEQCKKTSVLQEVIVATDDARIEAHVKSFGGKVILTSPEHQSGTDRCAEIAAGLDCDAVINIQGDEPFIDPAQVELLASAFENSNTQIASLVKKITSAADVANPNVVKAVLNLQNEAIYFSRSAVPYNRTPGNEVTYYKHIGIYGYRKQVLLHITRLPVSTLEKAESLEQLRWIENGYRIALRETDLETLAVDTPEDLQRILALHK
jgi:3-deoxy-manno-octulosonate cytidylyltransferase (CMP-KDO synthetase)